MSVQKLTIEEIKKLIEEGKTIALAEPVVYKGQIVINTEKRLTIKDLERLEKILSEEGKKYLSVVLSLPQLIKPELKNSFLDYVKTHLSTEPLFKNLFSSRKEVILKTVEKQILENDYVILQLVNMRKHSKKLFKHAMNVGIIAGIITIGKQKKEGGTTFINPKEIYEMMCAGFLHDIGLLNMDQTFSETKRALIYKDNKLYEEFKKHPIYSARIIEEDYEKHLLPYEVSMAILQHEERLDGTGFPNKSYGNDFPTTSKILQIADFLELLYSNEITTNEQPIGVLLRGIENSKSIKEKFDQDILAIMLEEFKYLYKIV